MNSESWDGLRHYWNGFGRDYRLVFGKSEDVCRCHLLQALLILLRPVTGGGGHEEIQTPSEVALLSPNTSESARSSKHH